MALLGYFLGAVAKANSALFRQRVNGIPLSVVLILVLAGFSVERWQHALEAVHNPQAPLSVSVADIGQGGLKQDFVQVSGIALPTFVHKEKSGSVTQSWSSLMDRQKTSVLVIQHSGAYKLEKPELATVTGMLRKIDVDVRGRLSNHPDAIYGVPVQTLYQLEEGERPGDPRLATLTAALLSLMALAFIVVSFMRNMVFQGGGNFAAPLGNTALPDHVMVRASGRFSFDAKNSRRFTDVGAVVAFNNGEPIVLSRINYTSRFMGAVTSQQDGVWHLSIKNGSVHNGRFGYQYYGFERQYAYRFNYTDSRKGKSANAVIASDTPENVVAAAATLTGAGVHAETANWNAAS